MGAHREGGGTTIPSLKQDEYQAAPSDRPCPHCGFQHFKAGGTLKWHRDALNCHIYVGLVLEEVSGWGWQPVAWLQDRRPRATAYRCNAPPECICFHKGDMQPDGMLMCHSPDGYRSEVQPQQKYRLDPTQGPTGLLPDEALLCEYRRSVRRHPARPTERAPRGLAYPTPYAEHRGNPMPHSGDWRKQRVITELNRRIELIKRLSVTATPERIAKVGGFTQHRHAG